MSRVSDPFTKRGPTDGEADSPHRDRLHPDRGERPGTAKLAPRLARQTLGVVGRFLYDTRTRSLWERDTRSLPRRYRGLRRRYREFAQTHLAPRALAADRDPHSVDVDALFLEAARAGFQTELLPWPWGTGKLGGMLDALLMAAVLKAEELSAADAGLGLALLAHDLGVAPLFLSGDWRAVFGWQRRIYKQIAAGEPAICAYAITEPDAGSDVEDTEGAATARIATRARRGPGGFRISGRKCFISDGAVARWVTLFAALDEGGVDSWTCFLLDRDMSGFSVGRSERKMGQRAADASELTLDDVFVPDHRVIGPLGGGWAINRNVLNYSRPAIGAVSVGIARAAFEYAAQFCNDTRLGGRPLASYQEIQLRLASMLSRIQAARALVWQAARYGIPFQAAGSMAKSFGSRVAWEVSTEAIELLGDHGTLHARGVEKAARDARLTLIYEGTHQINQLAIIEGQTGAEIQVGREA